MALRTFDDIAADFDFLEDWEDRYRYIIELGREMEPFPEEARTADNKVEGCVSQVWLLTQAGKSASGAPVLEVKGDSDAMIVRGLVAIVLSLVSGKTAEDILALDIPGELEKLGLQEHLSQQRANGLSAMIARIREEARKLSRA